MLKPLAEAPRRFTPYHYGNNNPARFIDPDGRITVDNLSGQYTLGSAVASFLQRSGVDEEYLPKFYSDDSGVMIVNTALGNDGQGGGATIGQIMDGLGFEASGNIDYLVASIGVLNLRQQLIDAGWDNPESTIAKFDDWMDLVNKVPELFNLYSRARAVFKPISGEDFDFYAQLEAPFSNKVLINTNKLKNILNYSFTIGHEMFHIFDDKYNFRTYMSLYSDNNKDFQRDRYTLDKYYLFKEYRAHMWEKGLGNDINIDKKLETYRILWKIPMNILDFVRDKTKILSNTFLDP